MRLRTCICTYNGAGEVQRGVAKGVEGGGKGCEGGAKVVRSGYNWVKSVVRRGTRGCKGLCVGVAEGVQRVVIDRFEDNIKCTDMLRYR